MSSESQIKQDEASKEEDGKQNETDSNKIRSRKADNEESNLASDDVEVKKRELSPKKIKVHFVPVGNAPIMKRAKFSVNADDGKKFASLNIFLRKILKLGAEQSLFLYIKSSFVPSPDECLNDLNECFSVRGELIVNYALQEAWG